MLSGLQVQYTIVQHLAGHSLYISSIMHGETLRIILIWIFRKWEGVARTGWSWLRIGTGGGHLWVR